MKGFPSLNTFLCKTYKQSNHRQDITVVESHSMAMFLVVEVNETSMVQLVPEKQVVLSQSFELIMQHIIIGQGAFWGYIYVPTLESMFRKSMQTVGKSMEIEKDGQFRTPAVLENIFLLLTP